MDNADVSVRQLIAESHALAKEKGWWRGASNIPEKLALIHSEVSEALEEFRVALGAEGDLALQKIRYEGEKPEGFVVELADVVIRIADLCGALGLDLVTALQIKAAYNRTRPYRHGGKRA